MTAPDPGLTDLIAAHTSYVDDSQRYCKGCDWTSDPEIDRRTAETDHAAHVALVVEQHTNRRIAELEATIARVEKALAEGPLHRIDFPSSKDPYGIERQTIRAALEGDGE